MSTPIKAIRKKCLECYTNSRKGVATCPVINCPLYPYRMGMRLQTYQKLLDRRVLLKNKDKIEGGYKC